MTKECEIIKFEDGDFSLDVNVSPNEDTVWLKRDEIAKLFERDIKTISKHINNALEQECKNSTVAKIAIVQLEGSRQVERILSYYNLDVIISVGYRVKSERGVLFRKWANSILKQYLLAGQVINQTRCIAHSDNIIQMNNTIININDRLTNLETEFKSITTIEIFKNKVFYNDELFEGYSFIKNLFQKAKQRIIIIDGYIDYSVLEMLLDIYVDITIITFPSSNLTNREIQLFQQNHKLNVIKNNKYHDRFIIIDDELYNIGSSIKDIGKKITHISKLESININELLINVNCSSCLLLKKDTIFVSFSIIIENKYKYLVLHSDLFHQQHKYLRNHLSLRSKHNKNIR